jgi:hypothetical protein
MSWWQPYYANSAMAVRGLRDPALVWKNLAASNPSMVKAGTEWTRHSEQLSETLITSIRKNIRHDMIPPYIGPLPTKLTVRESMETEHPSPQQWSHRAYTELVHADVLPPDLANLVIDCMRAYGTTTIGVVANVGRPNPNGRAILGFISYGYAQMLLRLDRIEEYLLFLYSHRFHDHNEAVGQQAKSLASPEAQRSSASPRNSPFLSSCAGCSSSKTPTQIASTLAKRCRATG